ncbi:MAG: hypothetical protein EON93_16170, partial [Burkholderiales bacterium]
MDGNYRAPMMQNWLDTAKGPSPSARTVSDAASSETDTQREERPLQPSLANCSLLDLLSLASVHAGDPSTSTAQSPQYPCRVFAQPSCGQPGTAVSTSRDSTSTPSDSFDAALERLTQYNSHGPALPRSPGSRRSSPDIASIGSPPDIESLADLLEELVSQGVTEDDLIDQMQEELGILNALQSHLERPGLQTTRELAQTAIEASARLGETAKLFAQGNLEDIPLATRLALQHFCTQAAIIEKPAHLYGIDLRSYVRRRLHLLEHSVSALQSPAARATPYEARPKLLISASVDDLSAALAEVSP